MFIKDGVFFFPAAARRNENAVLPGQGFEHSAAGSRAADDDRSAGVEGVDELRCTPYRQIGANDVQLVIRVKAAVTDEEKQEIVLGLDLLFELRKGLLQSKAFRVSSRTEE